MAVFSLYPLNPIRSSHSSSSSFYGHPSYFNGGDPLSNSNNNSVRGRVDKPRRGNSSRVFVLSSHSNPKTIKSNRRSRYGQTLSPYDSDDEEEDNDDDSDDDWLSNDGSAELEESDAGTQRFKSSQSSHKHLVKNGTNTLEKRNLRNFYHTSKKRQNTAYLGADGRKKLEAGRSTNNRFRRLSEELDLDEKWFPLLDYLSTFGLKESHFIQMYERHMPSLQINVGSAQERLEYLLSVGVKHKDIKKVLLRQPQILGYTVESNLKSHVAFLLSLGIQGSRIGQIITATPSLFSYSVENSLKPTVRYLLEEVGIDKDDLSKVVQLSPQILVQRIDNTWNTRFNFLTKELGAPRDSIVKMVRKHPQLLHYSIEDGLLPRINFLRSIGMRNSEILKVLTSLTQVFSLSLEGNLKPKYMYLINELRNEWAGTSLEKYLAFRQTLLLKEFAQKYERK